MDRQSLYKRVKEQIKDFGAKPIKDVGKILNIVQSLGLKEKEVMPAIQSFYIKLYQEVKGADLIQARQSWVVASGNNFESFVRNFINDALNSEGILAVKGDRLRKNKKAKEIVEFLTSRASRRCTQTNTGVWPDSDIVVLTKDRKGDLKTFALLNCKTSDHSRNDAVLFWAIELRQKNIKYCLVTQDLDNRFIKGDFDKEISNIRKKSEAYLDRVFTTNPLTEECSQIRKLVFLKAKGADSLLNDLRIWHQDVIPDFVNNAISESILD